MISVLSATAPLWLLDLEIKEKWGTYPHFSGLEGIAKRPIRLKKVE